jgi:rhodanese-related sulfurtransferase
MITKSILTRYFVPLCLLAVMPGYAENAEPQAVREIPKKKQTDLGLYLTAKEAHQKWQADPENVFILDVRTPEEYIFVGHADVAWNIPLLFQTYDWDSTKQHFAMKPNPDFLSSVKERFTPDDTLLLMCRSGGRSAMAVNLLAEAGFKKVFNIIGGMEGDMVKDPENVFQGRRMKNGWKNSELPWTYKVNPEKMRLPSE